MAVKVEVKLSTEQLRKLDKIRRRAGLNTRTELIRALIQDRYLVLHPNEYSTEEDN